MTTSIHIPGLRLSSRSNARVHWRQRAREDKQTHAIVGGYLMQAVPPLSPCPRDVTLIRHGVRLLDDDNLAGSCKAARDAVARWFGADDGPKGPIAWRYAQQTGGYGLTIEIAWAPSGDMPSPKVEVYQCTGCRRIFETAQGLGMHFAAVRKRTGQGCRRGVE